MGSKRTKRELEARVTELEARVAEQSAVILRLMMAPAPPTLVPYPVPAVNQQPMLPYVQPWPFSPMPPMYPQVICGGAVVGLSVDGGVKPLTFDSVTWVPGGAAAGCAANPMLSVLSLNQFGSVSSSPGIA
jgi:hypothetical protein